MPNVLAHQAFANQAQKTPDAIAVVYKEMHLTYQEIDRRANQVAHLLQMHHIKPDTCVGICIDRSPEMVIGLLGILKAGGAYIPLDPLYPSERIAYILDNAQISVLLTQQRLLPTFTAYPLQTLCLDTIAASVSATALPERVLAHNLAYVIYTSGSTGRPKGVQIEHLALAQLLADQTSVFTVQPGDRVLQFASLSFDASVPEIFIPLVKGATLHLASQDDLLPGLPLLSLLQKQAITVVTLPPSVLAMLPAQDLPDLAVVLSAGETCSTQIVAHWSPGRAFFNAYGPTETTVCATMARCSSSIVSPPLGQPLPNKQIYLLDADLEPVPAGTSGEIYIGGEGLARGYLHQADRTAERFIPHPFTTQPGQRLYRTGDSARYLPNGSLEFLGRLDHQVKIRGFRIEPGEVEAALTRHPSISHALVMAQESPSAGVRLLAYIIPKHLPGPGVEELRAFVSNQVPAYMVPALFIRLNAFSLTPNGKIDRQALPMPDWSRPELDEAFVAPQHANEQLLADIWTSVLGLEYIGIHDNFLALGGHSLAATQIISRVRETFQVDLAFSTLFANPTVATILQHIQTLQATASALTGCPIQPAPRDQPLPLSFAQQQVWLIQQLTSDHKAYIAAATLKIEGDLRIPLLERSINELVKRHEILRTTFPTIDQLPVQLIHEPQSQTLHLIDLQQYAEARQEEELQHLIYEASSTPFDIAQLPLIRWILLRLHPSTYLLVIVEHHFVHDGWSSNMLLAELHAFYAAFLEEHPPSLPPPPIQYADFACWQHQWIQSAEAARQLAYWQQRLADCPTLLDLPLDRPRPPLLALQGATMRIQLSTQQYHTLKEFCRQEEVTPFMALFAVFLTLLYRYSGQADICIGSSIANRRWRAMEQVAGMVLNTIVLREQLTATATFRELLIQVRTTIAEASAHQDLPFERVVEALNPERSLSYNPIYQAMFNLHGAPLPAFELPNTRMHLLQAYDNGSVKVDLNVTVIPRPEAPDGWCPALGTDGMTLLWRYSTALFDATTITRMIDHYMTLLQSVLSDPQQYLARIPLLNAAELTQLLNMWNTSAQSTETPCTPVHRSFERQAAQTPDAPALTFLDQKLNYSELNARANQLAHYLQKQGVRSESHVAICMERSPDLIVSLLAVLKAGGTYLPLDPAYPPERLTFMCRDAQVALLLTHQHMLNKLPAFNDLPLVCLDDTSLSLKQEQDSNLLLPVDERNGAYIIYTSGSTGTPKGVLVEHRQLLNYIHSIVDRLAFPPHSRFALISTVAADLGNTMLFPALSTGGCLQIVPQELVFAPDALADYFHQHPIDCLKITPSHLAALLTSATPQYILPRSHLILGGEVSRWDLVARVQELVQDCLIVNHYGPTETTVGVVTYQVAPNAQEQSATPLPIGHPLANSQIYLLDPYLQPVPLGVTGEVYIGGKGVARGYLNQPQRTAEQFLPNPFGSDAGTRLYRTGDLARWRSDGVLEFQGRADNQIKVRGFRVELGEIETALHEHPAVRDAVVLAREDTSGEKRLIAYIVSELQAEITGQEALHAYLRTRLPEHMLPGSWCLLDTLPLLPNGKVDRRALPAPDWHRLTVGQQYVAPRTVLEEHLAQIWMQVLGLAQIGMLDNFFDVGGHSLKAMQVVARVQQLERVRVPLSSLFANPTIAGLASVVTQLQTSDDCAENILPIAHYTQVQPSLPTLDQETIDQFSDEQVTSLLREILGQGGHLHD